MKDVLPRILDVRRRSGTDDGSLFISMIVSLVIVFFRVFCMVIRRRTDESDILVLSIPFGCCLVDRVREAA